MGLVDYSDSESDTEPIAKPAAPTPPTTSDSKKPFQKVVDRSKPGKIIVNLPGASTNNDSKPDEPPAKRPRISKGGGAFSGFNSFLPAPKHPGKTNTANTSGRSNAPRPGVNLATGAAPAFSRNDIGDGDEEREAEVASHKAAPVVPADQKPADEVKLVGRPLMFKPLSVSRKPAKKTNAKSSTVLTTTKAASTSVTTDSPPAAGPSESNPEPPPAKKRSLFSIASDREPSPEPITYQNNGVYEPLITYDIANQSTAEAFAAYDAQYQVDAQPSTAHVSNAAVSTGSLHSLADGMNLSKAARRELFGRNSDAAAAAKVVNFDTEREYAHNEVLRASGEQAVHNPVRAIAPGKHNLRQLVNQVHNQRDALEESFAKGKAKQSEAGSRYGWR
ncbi:mitotic checkpoint regulator, MAD2B-interacting-domain-containing protein [Xylariaceae sp. FL1019]|nr:mitotic checkpoint regulator, MAD2B-interacting-domain-containing protein [Xylariaceae sp. FL1019]